MLPRLGLWGHSESEGEEVDVFEQLKQNILTEVAQTAKLGEDVDPYKRPLPTNTTNGTSTSGGRKGWGAGGSAKRLRRGRHVSRECAEEDLQAIDLFTKSDRERLEFAPYGGRRRKMVAQLAAIYCIEARACGRTGQTFFRTEQTKVDLCKEDLARVDAVLAEFTRRQEGQNHLNASFRAESEERLQQGLNTPVADSNIGKQMLKSMGWKEGSALGKHSESSSHSGYCTTSSDSEHVGSDDGNQRWAPDDPPHPLNGRNRPSREHRQGSEASMDEKLAVERQSRADASMTHSTQSRQGQHVNGCSASSELLSRAFTKKTVLGGEPGAGRSMDGHVASAQEVDNTHGLSKKRRLVEPISIQIKRNRHGLGHDSDAARQ
mmetsp:Transcript_11291/g.41315  ORF Transcript_11291/g.41315 Transcript_11291/m.41315 type:complete len:377 (+) Transcript_11291:262-1392(+)